MNEQLHQIAGDASSEAGDHFSRELLKRQRSHALFVLSDALPGGEIEFRRWYVSNYSRGVLEIEGVLAIQRYERHVVDITLGQYAPLPFRYLSILQISLDGANAAQPLIDAINEVHGRQPNGIAPATWLYYPVSDKVGRAPGKTPCALTLAFANPVAEQEREFREWYATRHIRHALRVPALVSGQCFERTTFQSPGSMKAVYHTIAVYEQEGTAESIIQSFAEIPASAFHFPTLDISTERFAEWVYTPV